MAEAVIYERPLPIGLDGSGMPPLKALHAELLLALEASREVSSEPAPGRG